MSPHKHLIMHSLDDIRNKRSKKNPLVQCNIQPLGLHGECNIIWNEKSNPSSIARVLPELPNNQSTMDRAYHMNQQRAYHLNQQRAYHMNQQRAYHMNQQQWTDHILNDYRIWPRSITRVADLKPHRVKTHNVLMIKDRFTGNILDWKEQTMESSNDLMSMLREPGRKSDFVRGSSDYQPFRPGGLEQTPVKHGNMQIVEQELQMLDHGGSKYLRVPPGFSHGIKGNKDANIEMEIGKNPPQLLKSYSVDVSSILEEKRKKIEDEENNYYSHHVERLEKQDEQSVLRLEDVYDDYDNDLLYSEDEEETVEIHPKKTEKKTSEVVNVKSDIISTLEEEIDSFLSGMDQEDFHHKHPDDRKTKFSTEWSVASCIDVSDFRNMVPHMAMEWPFDLDNFQKQAIFHLENNESVFVSAHTSAGKTVVAEYAIALAKKHLTRIIYTSPIKTLSNQKFREFSQTFGDVGIITGDVQINPTATCLIMTTEILRSMLYKGADLIRDVEWVIFDEVHYLNDPDRGVVWEEVIIMLPDHISLIMLSATIPNTQEFADWVGRTKKKKVHVIQTFKRPVPLEHSIYFGGNLFKIVDEKGNFLNGSYRQYIDAFKHAENKKKKKGFHQRYKTERLEIANLIESLRKKSNLPLITFSFSRKRCEELSYGLTKVDLTTQKEKSKIHKFVNSSFNNLKGTDRDLPQVIKIEELVKRGIGVHHSGMLPIVKEVVEILFSRGLIKALFATETFAMGVNMPAKTVLFNNIRKHDGKEFRDLLSSEYIQMAGRAGRRGLDTVGNVIIYNDKKIEEVQLMRMILGKSTNLQSRFKLTYNMILNLLRIEDFKVEDMIKSSFSESHNQKFLPEKQSLQISQSKISDIEDLVCINEDNCQLDSYYQATLQHERSGFDLAPLLHKLGYLSSKKLLLPGRMVTVKTKKYGNTLGLICRRLNSAKSQSDIISVLVVRLLKKNHIIPTSKSLLPSYSPLNVPSVDSPFPISDVVEVPLDKIMLLNHKLQTTVSLTKQASNGLWKENHSMRTTVQELIRLWQKNPIEGPTVYDPASEKLTDLDIVECVALKNRSLKHLTQTTCYSCPELNEKFVLKHKKEQLKSKLSLLSFALSDENLMLMPELTKKIDVLKSLKYIDEQSNSVQLKGRVACELNSAEELIVTEMIFENFFTPLSPAECVAMLSCLLCKSKAEIDIENIPSNLKSTYDKLIELTMILGEVQNQHHLSVDASSYVEIIRPAMIEVAYKWALGVPFKEITALTEIQEGNIVRSIVQIAHACREVRNAARVIGDGKLFQKMEEAMSLIKRDIVFTASLYHES